MGFTPLQATRRLANLVAASTDPVLGNDQLGDLLDYAARPYTVPRLDLMYLAGDQVPYNDAMLADLGPWGFTDHQIYLAPDTLQAWAAHTAYAVGALITASPRGKFRYKCMVAGTTGAAQPTWPLTGGTVVDGGVTWSLYGLAYQYTYDLNAAAAEGWRWKAGMAAQDFDVADGVSARQSQVYDHCMAMAKEYSRKIVQSVTIPPKHPRSQQANDRDRESIYGTETIGRYGW